MRTEKSVMKTISASQSKGALCRRGLKYSAVITRNWRPQTVNRPSATITAPSPSRLMTNAFASHTTLASNS